MSYCPIDAGPTPSQIPGRPNLTEELWKITNHAGAGRMRARYIVPLAIAFAAGAAGVQTPAISNTASVPDRPEIRLTYLGNAGWVITDGKTILIVDPYITQFRHPPGPATTGRPSDPQARLHPTRKKSMQGYGARTTS